MQPRIDSAHISLDSSDMAHPLQDDEELKRRESQKVVLSGNRVRSKPAKDAVITGILSSLQTLEPPQRGALPNTFFTEDASRPTTSASRASGPNVPFSSPGKQVDSDDEFDDEVAVAPVISRRPSGPTPAARTSSYGAVERSPRAASTRRDRAVAGPSESPTTRRLRRVASHDTLRQAEPDKDFQVNQDFILDGLAGLASIPSPDDRLVFAANDSTKLLGKARLYLVESAEDMRAKDPPDSDSRRSFGDRSPSPGPSTRVRPSRVSRSYPIGDSVPLRTSSLRQASSSPSSTRRTQRVARTSSMQRPISEAASDLHWKDLGENDETVKRILELRKKRETRLLDELSLEASSSRAETSRSPERHRLSETTRPTSITKASTLLGVIDASDAPHLGAADVRAGSGDGASSAARALTTAASPNPNSGLRSAVQPSVTFTRRPPTSRSNGSAEPALSLDYSYAQAVAALHGAEHEAGQRDSLDKLGMATASLQPPAVHRRTTSSGSSNGSILRPKKTRERSAYSDISEEKRDRRKSMSDARDGEPRRDSIDENVLQYLRAPRLSQKIKNKDTGRTISFSEVGDPKGAAVIVCVGMGLTRYVTAFFDELAVTLRLRLITIERPGVGESSPYADKSGPLMWPADVTLVCEHLGVSHFSMLAHSAGAVYALATALILPNMVRGSIHLLAPWIPPSQLEAAPYTTENAVPAGALPRGQRILRVLPTPFLKAANSSWISMGSLQPAKRKSSSSPSRISSLAREHKKSSDAPRCVMPQRPSTSGGRPELPQRASMMLMDRFVPDTNPMESFTIAGDGTEAKRRSSLFLSATATPADPNVMYASIALNAAEHAARERQSDFSTQLTQRTWEYAIKDSNPATDLIVCLERHREIGFRYTDVQRRVIITHGSEDKRVPVANVKWLAEQMNRAAMGRAANTRESLIDVEPGCEVRILPGEGHGLMASPIIMGDVLTEIAGYWTAEERGRLAQH